MSQKIEEDIVMIILLVCS